MCEKLSMLVQYTMFSFSFGIGNLRPAYLSPLSLSSLFPLMSPFPKHICHRVLVLTSLLATIPHLLISSLLLDAIVLA